MVGSVLLSIPRIGVDLWHARLARLPREYMKWNNEAHRDACYAGKSLGTGLRAVRIDDLSTSACNEAILRQSTDTSQLVMKHPCVSAHTQ